MSQRFSESDIAVQIRLLRDACRRVKARPDLADKELGPIVDVLDRLVAETGQIVGIREDAAGALASLPGVSPGNPTYEAGASGVSSYLAGAAPSDAELESIFEAEKRFWQQCEDAVETELAGTAAFLRPDDAVASARIDPAKLETFINSAVAGEGDVRVTGTRVASEGSSKVTLFVSLEGARTLPDSVVLRMDKAFNYLGTTVRDEFGAIRLLFDHGQQVPEPFILEPTGDVLGGAFLLVSRCVGESVGKGYFPPDASEDMMASIATALAHIHSVPVDTGVQIGAKTADDRPYIESEIDTYEQTWKATGGLCPSIDAAFAWIRANVAAAHGPLSIVHNDFDFHNIILDGDRVSGVVDWEFVHVGNPAADIGYLRDSIDRTVGLETFLAAYVAAGGQRPTPAAIDFYTVWGHVRLAIMSFQTEMAYRDAKFDDIRYALAGVHFMRKPILGYLNTLTEIIGRRSNPST